MPATSSVDTKQFGDVEVERRGHIAHVTIRKPPHNMMSLQLAADLANALETVDADIEARVVILASEGKSFCAGADLTRRAEENGLDDGARSGSNPLYEQAARLYATQLPMIAAIQGPAVGAGLGLALVADFRVASTEARFAANFVKLGFHPGFGLTYTLPRLVGRQCAAKIFLTGDRYSAESALDMGLVEEVVAPQDLQARALEFAERIAVNAPLAVRATRATLRAGLAARVLAATEEEFAEQAWLMKTEDFREGVKAVGERRPGNFKAR